MLRDIVTEQTGKIIVDNPEVFEELQRFGKKFVPEAVELLELYNSERPLFDQYNLEKEIEASLSRRVDLKSGGYLIIDQTEAMTTIDVNTGAFVGRRDFSDSKEHEEGVLTELRKAVARDRNRISISEFTSLGLVQITRKRTRESLAHTLCETCPTCGGRGEIKTARTVCYEILREVVREYHQFKDAKEFRILASQSVIDLFLDEESEALALVGDSIQKPITLSVETEYNQEQYDVLVL